MNICEDRHEPDFKVTYRPAKGHDYCPVWLVCEGCLENKDHFGSEDLIQSKVSLSEITA